ncbi:hypothetical protein Ahy_B08g090636 [Arachis hypogaea]|uniref:Major facilitator superfamily (MFS) profile domain-containing protein n=1 Tax=Arachis hypogaea TaxID=3818 RepID=A0A444Y0C2_ARAHY|nr:hypothetical protein Ahy_B08g090636 [Arachis hypogaea]
MGFFTDAYDLFCISLVTKLPRSIYYIDIKDPKPGVLPPNVQAAVTGVALSGTLAGQLFFGWLDDKMRSINYFQVIFLHHFLHLLVCMPEMKLS